MRSSYTLIDLLGEVSRQIQEGKIRKIILNVSLIQSFELEVTDGYTKRLKYSSINNGKKTIKRYYENTQSHVAVLDMNMDISAYLQGMQKYMFKTVACNDIQVFKTGSSKPLFYQYNTKNRRYLLKEDRLLEV